MADSLPPLVNALMFGTFGLSIVTMSVLLHLKSRGHSLLVHERRRPVPWGTVAVGLALVLPTINWIVYLGQLVGWLAPSSENSTGQIASRIIFAVVLLSYTILSMAALSALCGATRRDLGLPASMIQLLRDIWRGLVAFFAVFLPVYLLLYVLNFLFEPDSMHPLIDEIEKENSTGMMLAAVLLAVVAAPVFEEFCFRLVLQGWLEKWEDQWLGVTAEPGDDSLGAETQLLPLGTCEGGVALPPPLRERGMLFELPRGWSPILISGCLFGAAHLGNGVSPVPLALLGFVLGYLYHRTHRLAPSIACHMVFNAYTMLILWLTLGAQVAGGK